MDDENLLTEFEDEDKDSSTTVMEVTVVKVMPSNLDEANGVISEMEVKMKILEDDLLSFRNKIREHETVINLKDDEITVSKGIVNSLEEDIKKKDVRINRFEKATVNMKKEIDFLREFKAGGGVKNKKETKEIANRGESC